MPYLLNQPLQSVAGIGPTLAAKFASKSIYTVKDLLLFLPLRYEDRSQIFTIKQIQEENDSDDFKTIRAQVNSTSNFYKGRRSIQSASISDETGKLKLMWFNNPWIIKKLTKHKEYFFSGKINEKGIMMQPIAEEIRNDNIHTGRLVPIYSSLENIKQGTLRRILKNIIDNLESEIRNPESKIMDYGFQILDLHTTLTQLHFPETQKLVIQARERLALEELLSLIKHSNKIKKDWQKRADAIGIKIKNQKSKIIDSKLLIPSSISFELTKAQKTATKDILADISKTTPMNRLLIGDVGSGKTVVAGIACHHIIKSGYSACLIAPTQILAQQHVQTFQKLFPKIKIKLITGKSKATTGELISPKPSLFIGTHALINKLDQINPALIIYDEQHRFGVHQRSINSQQSSSNRQAHVLTMSATPIPRSLMLTIFSHLQLSVIDELPPGRKPVTTWLVPPQKRQAAYDWLFKKLNRHSTKTLALIVVPFIHPSEAEAFGHVKNTSQVYEELKSQLGSSMDSALLHSQLATEQKNQIIQQLFDQKLNLLVTTPMIEVGLDVANADVVVIESAERFGLASLHQLRGRVGRAGQESYCLVIPSQPGKNQRLQEFTKEHNGMKLAQKDLKRRGAGNLFGTEQSGFDQLKFANWTNLEIISKARQIFEKIEKTEPDWQPFFEFSNLKATQTPAAN